jgi:hypothetical protein
LENEIEGFFKIKPVKSGAAFDMGQIQQVIEKNILSTKADNMVQKTKVQTFWVSLATKT